MTTFATGKGATYEVEDVEVGADSYRCHLAIVPEDDGTFSALAMNLPGAGSCGDTEEQAILNAREAVAAVIWQHEAEGRAIPWIDATNYDVPDRAKQKWILVNA